MKLIPRTLLGLLFSVLALPLPIILAYVLTLSFGYDPRIAVEYAIMLGGISIGVTIPAMLTASYSAHLPIGVRAASAVAATLIASLLFSATALFLVDYTALTPEDCANPSGPLITMISSLVVPMGYLSGALTAYWMPNSMAQPEQSRPAAVSRFEITMISYLTLTVIVAPVLHLALIDAPQVQAVTVLLGGLLPLAVFSAAAVIVSLAILIFSIFRVSRGRDNNQRFALLAFFVYDIIDFALRCVFFEEDSMMVILASGLFLLPLGYAMWLLFPAGSNDWFRPSTGGWEESWQPTTSRA